VSPVARAASSWLASAGLALAVIVGVGVLPTLRLAGAGALGALAAGCGVATLGAFAGAVPVLWAVAAGGSPRPQVVAGLAMALRAGVTLGGALVATLGTDLVRVPFLVWVALAYGALLVVETRWMVRWLPAGGST
jgi:hypothetical protein